jgi:hypothetical protein
MSEQLIHIIPLDNNICHPVKIGNNVINLKDLKNFEYLLDSNFERTTVSINNTDVIDLNVRSSWTNILDFWIHCPIEAKQIFDENYVHYENNTKSSFFIKKVKKPPPAPIYKYGAYPSLKSPSFLRRQESPFAS